jgi:hypothetical protein
VNPPLARGARHFNEDAESRGENDSDYTRLAIQTRDSWDGALLLNVHGFKGATGIVVAVYENRGHQASQKSDLVIDSFDGVMGVHAKRVYAARQQLHKNNVT